MVGNFVCMHATRLMSSLQLHFMATEIHIGYTNRLGLLLLTGIGFG